MRGWTKLERDTCDSCDRVAVWVNPDGELRCNKCPRPEYKEPASQLQQDVEALLACTCDDCVIASGAKCACTNATCIVCQAEYNKVECEMKCDYPDKPWYRRWM